MLLYSSLAQSICLNPFGCEPTTLSECEERAAREAKTEYAAKSLINRCQERFSVSETICMEDAQTYKPKSRPNQKLAEILKKHPELAEWDDQSVLDMIHQAFYPAMNKAELGKKLGIDDAPHRSTCQKFFSDLYPKSAR
jgi:hypothetical protein